MLDQKIIVIGYDEIVLMLGLLGIEGYTVEKKEEFLNIFKNVIKDTSVGIIIVGLDLPKNIFDYLIEYKLNYKRPVIFILPDIFQENVEGIDPILLKIQDSLGEII
jgi:vacuolar-type H+-ATPase subunit F/Vma7